MRFFL